MSRRGLIRGERRKHEKARRVWDRMPCDAAWSVLESTEDKLPRLGDPEFNGGRRAAWREKSERNRGRA